MLGQQPSANGRHRAVDGVEQAAGALAGEGSGEFEIGACRRIDGQRRPARLPRRRRQSGPRADLRALDIEQGRAGGGEFGPPELPEPVEGRDAELFLDPPLRRGGFELRLRQGRDRGSHVAPEPGQRRI